MSLQEQIELDLIQARKDKDAEKTGVLQLIKAAIEKEQIVKKAKLTEDEVIVLVKVIEIWTKFLTTTSTSLEP